MVEALGCVSVTVNGEDGLGNVGDDIASEEVDGLSVPFDDELIPGENEEVLDNNVREDGCVVDMPLFDVCIKGLDGVSVEATALGGVGDELDSMGDDVAFEEVDGLFVRCGNKLELRENALVLDDTSFEVTGSSKLVPVLTNVENVLVYIGDTVVSEEIGGTLTFSGNEVVLKETMEVRDGTD